MKAGYLLMFDSWKNGRFLSTLLELAEKFTFLLNFSVDKLCCGKLNKRKNFGVDNRWKMKIGAFYWKYMNNETERVFWQMERHLHIFCHFSQCNIQQYNIQSTPTLAKENLISFRLQLLIWFPSIPQSIVSIFKVISDSHTMKGEGSEGVCWSLNPCLHCA